MKRELTRISDFIVARRILEIVCHKNRCDFVNLAIDFGRHEPCFDYDSQILKLPEEATLPQTIYSIVSLYVDNMAFICKKQIPNEEDRMSVKNFALALVRDFATSDAKLGCSRTDIHTMRLDQFPVVWMLLKTIICPACNLPLNNLQIIAGPSGVADGAVLIDDNKGPLPVKRDKPFVFINLDIEAEAVRAAFLLVEVLRYLCMLVESDSGAEDILRSIVSEFYLRNKIVDFISMAYPDPEKAADFFATLSIICNSEDMEVIAIKLMSEDADDMVRTAQGMADNWWFLGLTEKMLEPARSEDWTVYETWKPITEELWAKVETQRRVRGLDEVPFEMLLRIMSEEQMTDETQTLQGLLSDDRIW